MAVITIRILRGASAETKRKLSQALTAAVSDTLDVPRADVTVLIEEFAAENWSSGGELQSDRGQPETMAYDLEALFKKPTDRLPEKKVVPKPAPTASPRKATAKSRSRR
jgi:4-oxalocrotonate tautomerase